MNHSQEIAHHGFLHHATQDIHDGNFDGHSGAVTVSDAGAAYAVGQRPKGSSQLQMQQPFLQTDCYCAQVVALRTQNLAPGYAYTLASGAHGC